MKGLAIILGALGVVSIFASGVVAIVHEVSAGPGLQAPSLGSAISETPGALREALSHDPILGFAIGVALLVAFFLVYRNQPEQE